jgi:hypothetical protein
LTTNEVAFVWPIQVSFLVSFFSHSQLPYAHPGPQTTPMAHPSSLASPRRAHKPHHRDLDGHEDVANDELGFGPLIKISVSFFLFLFSCFFSDLLLPVAPQTTPVPTEQTAALKHPPYRTPTPLVRKPHALHPSCLSSATPPRRAITAEHQIHRRPLIGLARRPFAVFGSHPNPRTSRARAMAQGGFAPLVGLARRPLIRCSSSNRVTVWSGRLSIGLAAIGPS